MLSSPLTFASMAAVVLPQLAVAATIPPAPVWPAGSCTDKTFSIPSWVISNFTPAGFDVVNRASDFSGKATCSSGVCTAAGNSAFRATVSVSGSSATVSIDDSWACTDKGPNFVTAHAQGTASIPLTSSGAPVYAETLVQGTLVAPVDLTPTYPAYPTGYNLSSCSARDSAPTWQLTNIEFTNYTNYVFKGEQILHYKGLYFTATLFNPAIQFTTTCTFTVASDPTTNPGYVENECVANVYGSSVGTIIGFDTNTYQLTVNQTWYCIENPTTNIVPNAIAATGSTKLSFTVTNETTYNNVLLIHYKQASAALPATIADRHENLPPFSLTDPAPTSGGCTVDSYVNPTYTLSTWSAIVGKPNNTDNPDEVWAFYFTIRIDSANVRLYTATIDPIPLHVVSTPPQVVEADVVENFEVQSQYHPFFSYVWPAGAYHVNLPWECNDKDAAHPLLFNGTSDTTVPHPICGPYTDNDDICNRDWDTKTFKPTSMVITKLEKSRN